MGYIQNNNDLNDNSYTHHRIGELDKQIGTSHFKLNRVISTLLKGPILSITVSMTKERRNKVDEEIH